MLKKRGTKGLEEGKKGEKAARERGLYVWRVEEESFTVSAVSLALEVDLRRLKPNRAL